MLSLKNIENTLSNFFSQFRRSHQEQRNQARARLTTLHGYLAEHAAESRLDELEADLFQQLQQLLDAPESQITIDSLIQLKEKLENYAKTKSQELTDLWRKPKGLIAYMNKHHILKPEHKSLISHLHTTSICARDCADLLKQLLPQLHNTFELQTFPSPAA